MNKLKKVFICYVLMLGAMAVLAGCGGATKTETVKADKPSENKTVPEAKKAEEAKPAETSEIAATGDEVGVPECDEFLKKYEICVKGKVPEAARASFNASMQQWRSAWKQAASNPQAKSALASGCKTTMETAKQSLSVYSCEW